jgi:hypothetical protein
MSSVLINFHFKKIVMKKVFYLFVILLISGIVAPVISNAQKSGNKSHIFFKNKTDVKHSPAFNNLHRGVINAHQAMVYDWSPTGSNWVLSSAEKYVYYPDGKLMFKYSLDPGLSDTLSKETSFYDINGNSTYESIEFKTGPGNWQMMWASRSNFSYFAPGKFSSTTTEDWDGTNSKWVNSYKTIYTHNGSGILTNQIDQQWDTVTSAWINTDKYEFAYDGNNKNNEIVMYRWNNNTWLKDSRIYVSWNYFNPYNIDEVANIDSAEIQEYDSVNIKFVSVMKLKITHDANGGYVETDYDWNGAWTPTTRSSEKYDSYKNYTGNIQEEWNGSGWDVVYEDNFLLTYASGYVTEKIERYWQQGDPAGVYTNSAKYVYSIFNSLKEASVLQIKAYPQPFENYLIIEIPENTNLNTLILLSDLNGKTVMSQILPGSTRYTNLDVSGLESGSYILNIQSANSKISKLVIKQ